MTNFKACVLNNFDKFAISEERENFVEHLIFIRAKIISKRLCGVNKYVCFAIAALFHSPMW